MAATQYGVGVGLQDMGLITGGGGYTCQDGLVALAGGGQTGATPLNKAINRVATVATAADSVSLPAAVGGQVVYVSNSAASNAMQVFAASGTTDTINGTAGSTGISVAAGKGIIFFSAVAGRWHGVLSA